MRALRACPELDVRVVAVAGAPWSPPAGLAARLVGPALAPATVTLDGGELRGADIVVNFVAGEPNVEPPHGVWSFRLGDSDARGLPFAREIAAGAVTVEIALLSRTGERVRQLRRGRFGVTRWHPSTLRRALGEAAGWPAVLAGALAAGVALDGVPAAPAPPARPLAPLEQLRFGGALFARLAASLLENLLEVTEWNVGFSPGGPREVLAGTPLAVRWLPRPCARSFLADPFVVERDGLRVLFAEDYDYDRDRGVIDALVLDDAGAVVRRERALDIPTHVSYPYPLEIDGELYLIPENCAGNEVAFYRCVEFPHRWERESALLPAFDGVDTTLFQHDGRWWALCTRYSRGSTLALYAFHAPSVRGPWAEHLLNPVVVDVASARPGGPTFVVDDVLYRPAQDCSASYGGGLVVMRIDALTPNAYHETPVRRIDPSGFGRYRDGVHTLSFARGLIVVDGKHVYRDVRKLGWAARRMRRRLGRLLDRRWAGRPNPA